MSKLRRPSASRTWLGLSLLFSLACSREVRRFPLAPPLWSDADERPFAEQPGDYYSGIRADAVDKFLLYPLSNIARIPRDGEALNVNALDEVPNSSWFQNRVGVFDYTPAQIARAECGDTPELDPANGKWLVVNAKPDGANPGFFIEAPDGHRYLLKFDGKSQPLRASTADVVGSKLYWALGYHSVCNEVVYFQPDNLVMEKGAITKTALGEKRPMTQDDIATVLAQGFRLKDGRVRASASRFVPGKPLGPFKYEDTRADDPNDVVPHEDRRELRAAHLPAAWINHIDAREQNTFDVVIEEEKRKFIRHYKIDWGDSLGIGFNPDRLARRFGYSYAIDFEQMGQDLVSFGLLKRPWHDPHRSKVKIFGYYGVDGFVPSEWRGVYSIPAFSRRTPNDVSWMTRIMSRITDEHIRAIVARAKLPDERQSLYLERVLIGRRDKFFEEYFSKYVPLSGFRMARRTPGETKQSLCFEDLGIQHGVSKAFETYYQLRFRGGLELERELGWVQFMPDAKHPAWACVVLPLGDVRPAQLAGDGAYDDDPLRYGVMDLWVHQKPTVLPMGQVRLHFYDLGESRGYRLVGIERPREIRVPMDY